MKKDWREREPRCGQRAEEGRQKEQRREAREGQWGDGGDRRGRGGRRGQSTRIPFLILFPEIYAAVSNTRQIKAMANRFTYFFPDKIADILHRDVLAYYLSCRTHFRVDVEI